jgi:CSLREA domain-containing protein
MSRRTRAIAGRGFAAALIGMIATLAASAAGAQTITVNSTADDTAGGHCTLREAINLAQLLTPTGNCTETGSGPLTINFSAAGTGTITLVSTLPTISAPTNLTITGPGSSSSAVTIDGGGNVRQILLQSGTLNLQNLTLTDGNPGATDFGGAISNALGTLNIVDCTFSSNTAADGGAIYNQKTLTIVGSTFSGNIANNSAGPVGGAILNGTIPGTNSGVTATITNTTFSGNQAQAREGVSATGGAIVNSEATLNLVNDTFSGNLASTDGGVFGDALFNSASATTNLKGTIVASDDPSHNCFIFGTFNDDGYNIADDDSCKLNTTPPGTSLVVNATSDIGLASALGANGGPTETIALSPSSSNSVTFIPQASCTDLTGAALTIDQRNFGRPVNGTCSVGAYQYLGTPPPPPIDCSKAYASNANLTAVLPVFASEYVFGVNNNARAYNLRITGVTQDKPVPGFPLCPNAFWSGTTTYVRVTNEPLQPGPSGLLYEIEFTATDIASGASCQGEVPVCVQGLFNSGQPCLPAAGPSESVSIGSFDATKCP